MTPWRNSGWKRSWLVEANGTVLTFGYAPSYGDASHDDVNDIVAMAVTALEVATTFWARTVAFSRSGMIGSLVGPVENISIRR